MFAGAIPAAHQENCRVLIASSDPGIRNRSIAETGGQEVSFEEAPSGAQAMARLRSLHVRFADSGSPASGSGRRGGR